MSPDRLLELALDFGLAALALAMLLAFVRLVRGPSLADRVVALDVIAAGVVGSAVLYALDTGLAVFIDVAMAIALVTFLGTVALSRAIEFGGRE